MLNVALHIFLKWRLYKKQKNKWYTLLVKQWHAGRLNHFIIEKQKTPNFGATVVVPYKTSIVCIGTRQSSQYKNSTHQKRVNRTHRWWQIRDAVNNAFLWYCFFGIGLRMPLIRDAPLMSINIRDMCKQDTSLTWERLEAYPNKMRLGCEIHPRRVWTHPHLQWERVTSKMCLKYPRPWCLIPIRDPSQSVHGFDERGCHQRRD